MIDRAITWIKRYTIPEKGIVVHSRQQACYPEVTGYCIPTLLSYGDSALARQYATWLCQIQQPDGSFLDPDGRMPFAFDTGQVIRGWNALLPSTPALESPLRRACDWMLATADSRTGRLLTPDGAAWSMGSRGAVSEGVHLYALGPLRQAGELLRESRYTDFVDRSKRYYFDNVALTNFEQRHMLTHLFCYIQEALFDLGEHGLARQGMDHLARFQQDNGALPGYFDVPWMCTPGQIQAAIVWYKLGERTRADRALAFAEQFMNPSGGFFGSYGMGADYFPAAELSWASKFFLDACQARITTFFDAEHAIFPTRIGADDGRLSAIAEYAGDLNGRSVLDVGCGKGRFAAALKQRFPRARISGVDISAELLKAVPADIATQLGSMLHLPWPDRSFDVLYCVEALEHVQCEKAALREMSRLLKPGGHLVIIDKNAERWGAFKTPAWEKWFKPEPLAAQLRQIVGTAEWKYVTYEKQPADGLFVAWHGRKSHTVEDGSATTSAPPVAAGGARESCELDGAGGLAKTPRTKVRLPAGTSRALDSEEWHEAITAGAKPAEIAASARAGNIPEWVKPVLEFTQPGDVVLEQGSGTAAMSAWLALQGRQVVLLDYSQACLDFGVAVFRELGLPAPETHCADIRQTLPMADGAVDFVWSSGVLEHFSDAEIIHILAESRRVARKQVFSLVPNARAMAYRLGKWDQEKGGRWKYGYEDPKYTLAHLFERAGLQSVREFTIGTFHSLNFLDSPGLVPLRKALDDFLRQLPASEVDQLDQGYLLGTVGGVGRNASDSVEPADVPLAHSAAPIAKKRTAKRHPRIGLYIGSWPQNIGNAFFDLGAKALLRAAVPEATFFPMGGAVHWMFRDSAGRQADAGQSVALNSFEIGQAAEVDLIVFAGMSMCCEFAETNGRTFLDAAARGVATLGLGVGGAAYTEQESEAFSAFLRRLGRHAIITRDDETFALFENKIGNIWPGIDCAFFLPDYYAPPRLQLPPFDVEAFDAPRQRPAIDHEQRIVVQTHHDLWGPLPSRYTDRPNTLVSDVPEDYLTLYSQVTETHSDRLHACVATLAYGNKARLYNASPRNSLFAKVGAEHIKTRACRLDMAALQELKQRQVRQTRLMVDQLIG